MVASRRAAIVGELRSKVAEKDTAAGFGPDFPRAASTPFVLGLGEVASHEAIRSLLQAGEITVGIRASIEHLAPSSVGAELIARSRLVRKRGRRFYFDIEVWDRDSVVARIKHQRAIVDAERMRQRLEPQ